MLAASNQVSLNSSRYGNKRTHVMMNICYTAHDKERYLGVLLAEISRAAGPTYSNGNTSRIKQSSQRTGNDPIPLQPISAVYGNVRYKTYLGPCPYIYVADEKDRCQARVERRANWLFLPTISREYPSGSI
jgi:hypothetical protein